MCRGLGSDRSPQYRKGKGFAHFFWKFLVTCCHSEQHSAPFHLWKAQTHKELAFPRGQLRERPQVSNEALSGQRQRRGDRVTARRERGRKKEKTRERKVSLGWKVLHTFGVPRWKSRQQPHGSQNPSPSMGWEPSGVCQGGSQSGMQRSCLPFCQGSGLFPCIGTKR